MDPTCYKNLVTSRGVNYHYYFSAPKDKQLTLLLLHGFPSSSFDWHNQVTHLKGLGYGLVVPDMLGYGGTTKPTNPEEYKSSLMIKDITEILDAETVGHCVVIGHDWGSKIASRLANYCPGRFIGFGFFAVGYIAPNPTQTFEERIAFIKKLFGREFIGYQAFFAEPEAHKLCEKNFDSFYSLVHANNSETLWVESLSPSGETRKWVEQNKQAELSTLIPAEDHEYRKGLLQKDGLEGPMCWYKITVGSTDVEDDKLIPLSAYEVEKPVFLGLAEKDPLALPAIIKPSTEKWCKNITVKSFNGGHWLLWDSKDDVNKELGAWLETLSPSV